MDASGLMIRVGFGATVLAQGLRQKQLDGIGYYSQELARALLHLNSDIYPVVFGQSDTDLGWERSAKAWGKYKTGALISAVVGCAHPGSTNEFDLFHATDHHIPKLRQTPVLATLMDAIPLAHPEWASARLRILKNNLWKHAAHWADHIVTISEYSRDQIIENFGIHEQRISVVPLGVEQRYFDRIEDQYSQHVLQTLGLRAGYFLFVGTLQPRKNLLRVIQAHQALPQVLRQARPLVIVGRNGWGSDSLVRHFHSISDQEPVYWLGRVSDLQKRVLLQNAAALVFPSLCEGFGLPVLEAFASFTPVITSNTTSLPEVAADAAWLVNPFDVEEIAHAMRVLGEEESLSESLRVKGLARARNFTWLACAQATHALYKDIVSGRVKT